MSKKRVKKQIDAAVDALREDVASWTPTSKRWPKPGQRVRLAGNHPWRGMHGEVIGFENTKLFPAESWPKVRMENGRECFITQPGEWESA